MDSKNDDLIPFDKLMTGLDYVFSVVEKNVYDKEVIWLSTYLA